MKSWLLILVALLCVSLSFADVIKVKEDANLRDRPSTNSNIVKVAKAGESFTGEICQENTDWYQVSVNGDTCYISKSLVKVTSESTGDESADIEWFYVVWILSAALYGILFVINLIMAFLDKDGAGLRTICCFVSAAFIVALIVLYGNGMNTQLLIVNIVFAVASIIMAIIHFKNNCKASGTLETILNFANIILCLIQIVSGVIASISGILALVGGIFFGKKGMDE